MAALIAMFTGYEESSAGVTARAPLGPPPVATGLPATPVAANPAEPGAVPLGSTCPQAARMMLSDSSRENATQPLSIDENLDWKYARQRDGRYLILAYVILDLIDTQLNEALAFAESARHLTLFWLAAIVHSLG
jgi:hypothetical protein